MTSQTSPGPGVEETTVEETTAAPPLRTILRLEGAATLLLALVLYSQGEFSWTLLLILFLAPDLSFIAYLAGPRVGAIVYNVFHSWIGPFALAALLLLVGHSLAIPLIWSAHIGFDRMLGYGLKLSTGFSYTHLGMIGPRRQRGA